MNLNGVMAITLHHFTQSSSFWSQLQ